MWIKPIYDRTLNDVMNKTPKGFLNVSDLNRIENNTAELGSLLGLDLAIFNWKHDSIPTSNQFQRILNNLTIIKRTWVCVTENIPTNPINTFEKVNTIEKILDQVYTNFKTHEQVALKVGEKHVSREANI